jgi:sortase A
VIGEGNSLLKVGLIMMVLALALVIAAAVVVSVTLGSERLVAAEVTTKTLGEASRYSSGQEGSATRNSSSQNDFPRSSSEEQEKESLRYGSSSSSGGPVGQREEEAKEPQAVLQQEAYPPNSQSPMPQLAGQQAFSEASSGPQSQPQQHQPHQQEQPLPGSEQATKSPGETPRNSSGEEGRAPKKSSSQKESPRSSSGGPVEQRKEETKEPQAVLQQEEAGGSKSQSATPQLAGGQTPSEASSGPEPQPQQHQPQLPEQPLPDSEGRDWQKPTQGELNRSNAARHYELLPGAIMGLTIEAIGIIDAPVFDSDSQWALAYGVAHHPQTSLPWSPTAQRNVFLAGHRMGYRGTWSRMIFYNLDKLKRGDEVVLKDRAGNSYRYRVSEVLITDPTDVWVMGQVRGRDMLTLQTCTPIPTFQKRLIVRADLI